MNEQKTAAYMIEGKADGRGYYVQQKYTICDVYRPCHSILSMHATLSLYSLRLQLTQCLDLQIW